MEKQLFNDLVQSMKEAKAIAKGEAPASRKNLDMAGTTAYFGRKEETLCST